MTNQQEPKIDLTGLSVPEMNTILEGLAAMPYGRVHALVQRIGTEAQRQLEAQQAAAAAPVAEGG